jgi:dolichol-phosphate mannosyltransferase
VEETTQQTDDRTTGDGIAVVVPCYRVVDFITGVLERIGPEVGRIYCVDDACPDKSGDHVEASCSDPRVTVLRNETNLGVGGATLVGFRRAKDDGARIVVKIDGDGQMDPALIPRFVRPILAGRADYTKGNRFYNPSSVRGMPMMRVVGNGALSFLTKLSSGYWNVFDPTNGYVAIHAGVLDHLPLDRISPRYFFESDMLYNLNIVRAVVEDVPMKAVYGDEESHLSETKAGFEFLFKHLRNLFRRLIFNYYLRNFSVGSVEIVLGIAMLGFGVVFGGVKWIQSSEVGGEPVTAGTVMLAGLPVMVGLQLILSFLNGDTRDVPQTALHRRFDD